MLAQWRTIPRFKKSAYPPRAAAMRTSTISAVQSQFRSWVIRSKFTARRKSLHVRCASKADARSEHLHLSRRCEAWLAALLTAILAAIPEPTPIHASQDNIHCMGRFERRPPWLSAQFWPVLTLCLPQKSLCHSDFLLVNANSHNVAYGI